MYPVILALVLITLAANSAINDRWPRYSPDGAYIAFNSTRSGNQQIYTMRADGTGIRQITKDASRDELIGEVRWLPSGDLLYSVYAPARIGSDDYDMATSKFIEVTATGENARVIYAGINQGRPSASPAGNELVFEAAHGAYSSHPPFDLDVFDMHHLTLRPLTHGDGEYLQAAWSPDGTRIAYGCSQNGDAAMQICVMERNGARSSILTHGIGAHQWPSWSPDSKHLAFFVERRNGQAIDADIGTVDADGTHQKILTPHAGTQRNETPDWSPDGKHIAFQTDRGGNGLRIAVMNADGSEVRMLTQ